MQNVSIVTNQQTRHNISLYLNQHMHYAHAYLWLGSHPDPSQISLIFQEGSRKETNLWYDSHNHAARGLRYKKPVAHDQNHQTT